MTVRVTKCNYFSALITSTDSCPEALFWVTQSLLRDSNIGSYLHSHYEEYAAYLANKVACIHSTLDSRFMAVPVEAMGVKSSKVIWGEGSLILLHLRKWTRLLWLLVWSPLC